MFILCKPSESVSEIVYCANTLSSLRKFVNSLLVPWLGLSLDVYDSLGQYYGSFVRSNPFFNATFIKSPRYGKEYDTPSIIVVANKSPEMGARCRHLLDRCYPKFSDVDFVCFCATNFD